MMVTAPNGTDLRREPHTNPKTENGEDNVIRSLPKDTYVRLENDDIYATSKDQWARVTLYVRSKPITGWVIFDDLGPAEILASSATYPVIFDGRDYKMYQDKLMPAKRVGYILRHSSERASLSGMVEITINGSRYLTTQGSVDAMRHPGMRWMVD